jgi:hypothetical protein
VPFVLDTYAPEGKLYVTPADFAVTALHLRASLGVDALSYGDILQLSQENGVSGIEYYTGELGGTILYQAIAACIADPAALDQLPEALTLYQALSRLPDQQVNPGGLMYFSTIYSFSDLQFWRAAFGEEPTLLGLNQTGGTLVCPVSQGFAMNQNTQYPQGVWEFLRILLTADYQEENRRAFPTNQAALDAQIAQATTTGDEEILLPFTLEGVSYTPVSQEDVAEITAFLEQTQVMDTSTTWANLQRYDEASLYVQQFLAGELTLEDTVSALKQVIAP